MELDDRVLAERVDGPFAQLPVALVTVAVNSSLLSYVLWGAVDHARIAWWLASIWAVTLARIALLRAYRRRSPSSPARPWGRRFCVGAAANGVVWGAAAVVLYRGDDLVLQVFLAFVLGGMTAGAAASSSTYFRAFAAFAVPALTPMVVRVLDEGDRVHLMVGAMLALFGLAMATIARTSGQRLVESIRLRFMNEELNRELEARVAARTAELVDANRVKDEFLAVVSHELRTPLTAVIGWAQLLKSGGLPAAKRQHAIEIIERNGLAQAKLIEDLLDLSRITSGHPSIERVPLEPAELVDAAIEAIRPVMTDKGIDLVTHVDRTPGIAIRGDAARIQQIVGNLLGNAAKFTPRGGRVTLAMRFSPRWLELDVTDTGEGMAPEFIPLAFDRFRQARTAGARARSGLGLGLAISRQLAQLHGGTLEAYSEGLGRGSTFELRLPLDTSHEAPQAGAPGAAPEPARQLAGIEVLLVEDDRDTREVVGAMIEQAGATAIAVAGTDEALAALRSHHPSIIVSDLDMHGGGGDGFALIRAVRFLPEDEGGSVPAIALTAHAGAAHRAHALEAGFQDYVTKPVGPAQLIERIAGLTRG